MSNEPKKRGRKEELLQLARSGGLRPKRGDSLGEALKNYCNPRNPAYDEAFCILIKTERPDWFERKSTVKKAALLELAKEGKDRNELPQGLATALKNYLNPKGTSYDPMFEEIIARVAPKWLVKKKRGS